MQALGIEEMRMILLERSSPAGGRMKIMPAKTATKMAMTVRPATLAGFLV